MGGTCRQLLCWDREFPGCIRFSFKFWLIALGREGLSKSVPFPSARLKGITEAVHSLRFCSKPFGFRRGMKSQN
jgi:hypothetical protein